MVDYDVLPEIELRLHSLTKEIHQSMDELLKIKEELPEEDPSGNETGIKAMEQPVVEETRSIVERTEELKAEGR